jgi:hypothetical protein
VRAVAEDRPNIDYAAKDVSVSAGVNPEVESNSNTQELLQTALNMVSSAARALERVTVAHGAGIDQGSVRSTRDAMREMRLGSRMQAAYVDAMLGLKEDNDRFRKVLRELAHNHPGRVREVAQSALDGA